MLKLFFGHFSQEIANGRSNLVKYLNTQNMSFFIAAIGQCRSPCVDVENTIQKDTFYFEFPLEMSQNFGCRKDTGVLYLSVSRVWEFENVSLNLYIYGYWFSFINGHDFGLCENDFSCALFQGLTISICRDMNNVTIVDSII